MTISLFIGYAPNATVDKFFTNTNGKDLLDKYATTFKDTNELLDNLKEKYKKRKADFVGISDQFPEDDKQKIMDLLESRVLKVNL